MRVTQLRIFALLLTKIAVILSSVAISTDHWYILSYSPTSSRLLKDKSYSIFYECSNGNCKSISTNEGWRGAVIACLMIGLTSLVMALIGFIIVISMNKTSKPIAVLLMTSAISSCAALIIYQVKMKESKTGSMGISYYLNCSSIVITTGAGAFILAAKEERVAPFVENFSSLSSNSPDEVQL